MMNTHAIQLRAIVANVILPLIFAFPIGMLAVIGFLEKFCENEIYYNRINESDSI